MFGWHQGTGTTGLSVPQPRAAPAVVTGKYHEWGSHNPPFLPSRPRYRRFKPCEAAGGGGAVPWLCLTAASRPRLSPAMPRGPPGRGRGRSQVEPGDKSLWFCLRQEEMVLFSASISHGRGVLMDRWDASWLVGAIPPSVSSISSPSGRSPLMLLRKKKMYLGTILPACHMVEFRVSSFGDSGHLCESIVAFKFSLLLRFVLVMSRAGCKRFPGRRVQYLQVWGLARHRHSQTWSEKAGKKQRKFTSVSVLRR